MQDRKIQEEEIETDKGKKKGPYRAQGQNSIEGQGWYYVLIIFMQYA